MSSRCRVAAGVSGEEAAASRAAHARALFSTRYTQTQQRLDDTLRSLKRP